MKAKLMLSFSAIAFFAFSAAKMLAGGIDFPQSAHCPSDGDKVTQNTKIKIFIWRICDDWYKK